MKKGARVLNSVSFVRGTLVNGNVQDAPPHMHCDAVYSVKLDNGQYRYWDHNHVIPVTLKGVFN